MAPLTVTLLSSCHPLARERVVARLCVERPDVPIVRHELATLETDGCVHRIVRTADGEVDTAIGVDGSCCLSCLLRDDTLAALEGLALTGADQVVLVLPAMVEPEAVAEVLADHAGVCLGPIAVAVDAGRVEEDLRSAEPLAVELPAAGDDPRATAEVLARQLEVADVVVHDPASRREAALLAAMAPRAAWVLGAAPASAWLRGGPGDRPHRSHQFVPGLPRPRRSVDRDGVVTARWSRRRPLHALRLVEAFEEGALPGLARARGHLWVASRPATLLELEATVAGLELAAADAWLGALGERATTDAARRRRADAVWHPYWGDRVSDLVLVCLDHPPIEAVAALDRCLLTDEELALGEAGWRHLPDPLAGLGTEADHLDALTRQETL